MQAMQRTQSFDEALRICHEAERQNLGIVCDDQGTVELLYAAVECHAPTVARDLKQKAMQTIVKKMESELEIMARATGQESAVQLLQKLPGLGRFTASGKIGDLRNQWQQLKADTSKQILALAEQRKQIVSEFKHLLPDIPIRFEHDGTAVMYQDFTAPAHQEMVINKILDCNKYALSTDGMCKDFTGDLHRTFWKIEVDQEPPALGREMAEIGLSAPDGEAAQRKKTALNNLVGDDATALGTVSKLIHQGAVFIVSTASNQRSPRNPDCLLQSKKPNDASTFFRISRKDNHLEFECNAFYKIDQVNRFPSQADRQGKIWPTNNLGDPSEEPGLSNYGTHVRLRVIIDMDAARKGELRPLDGTQVEASVEYRIRAELPAKR
jgi:hypothetical protein